MWNQDVQMYRVGKAGSMTLGPIHSLGPFTNPAWEKSVVSKCTCPASHPKRNHRELLMVVTEFHEVHWDPLALRFPVSPQTAWKPLVSTGFLFFFFGHPSAMWSSQARDQIWDAFVTYAAAAEMLDPLTHSVGLGSNLSPGAAEMPLILLGHGGNSWVKQILIFSLSLVILLVLCTL